MNRRQRIRRLAKQVRDGEPQLQVGRVVGASDGAYDVIVNGRSEPRTGVAKNDFAFNGVGHESGDEVLVLSSATNDRPVIVGHSPWILNMEGTEYDA